MKRVISIAAGGLLLAGCAQQESPGLGSSPNNDTGMAEQNTVVEAGPDTAVGAGAAASSGMGTAAAHGSALTESEAAETNNSAEPQLPPAR